MAQAGQELSRSAAAQQALDFQERQLRLQEATAAAAVDKDFAQASYYRSLAARGAQDANATHPLPMPAAIPLPVVRQYGGDALEIQSYRVPIAGQGGSGAVAGRRAAADAGPVTGQVMKTAPSNPGVQYGPADALVKPFNLPFSLPIQSEFGVGVRQPLVYLPSAKDPGSAEPLESLEGIFTSAAIAAANVAIQGEDVWQMTKDAYFSLRDQDKYMANMMWRARRQERNPMFRGSGGWTGRSR